MKNKLVVTMLIILVSITLIGVIAVVVLNQLNGDAEAEEKEPTIDEIVESSIDVPELTTNIAGNHVVRLSLKIQTDSPESGEELLKRDFQVKDIVIEELSEMTKEQLEGRDGKAQLEEVIQTRVNELLAEGEVVRVYTTSIIIQ